MRLRPVRAAQRGTASRTWRHGTCSGRKPKPSWSSSREPAAVAGRTTSASTRADCRGCDFIVARSLVAAARWPLRDAADARRHAAALPVQPMRRAAASTAAGIVRSCRSTTASSASCQSTSCWRTSISRSRAGAEHITFGDPDFFNGPTHARRIVEALHERHPRVTYDVTIKVEHLLKHRDCCRCSRATGCLFVTSAVESVDDEVLAKLEKGIRAPTSSTRSALPRRWIYCWSPTFVAFTPWTTLEAIATCWTTVGELDLVEHVAPVQWGLAAAGHAGLTAARARRHSGAASQPFDPRTLTYPWRHDDPRVDALQTAIMRAGRRRG